MFGRFLPREGRFFDLFAAHAEIAVEGSKELAALMADLSQMEQRARNVEACEKRADKVTHETIDLLHQTFITPLDRDVIHGLITNMDDILDLMEDTVQSMYLYDVTKVTEDARRLADICVSCCERVKTVVGLLSNMENAPGILAICKEIDQLESDADRVMRNAMARLFREEADARNIIRLKAIYELLEEITDRCEDVANRIEGIVLENA